MSVHNRRDCEECNWNLEANGFGLRWPVWCERHQYHHDGYHADWSATCACGCRCEDIATLLEKRREGKL